MGIFHSYVELRLPFFMGATSPAALPQAAQVLLSRANSSLLWIAIALALIACCWSSLAGKNHGKPGFETRLRYQPWRTCSENHGKSVGKHRPPKSSANLWGFQWFLGDIDPQKAGIRKSNCRDSSWAPNYRVPMGTLCNSDWVITVLGPPSISHRVDQ